MDGKQLLFNAVVFGGLGGFAWAAMPTDSRSPEERAAVEQSVTYSGCNEIRDAGKAPLYAGQPGYREDMDGDGDGIACEPHRHNPDLA